MTDSFVTQCPHCQTSFRVSHAQLSVARGVVRCGSCLQVFNAAKQLLEQHAGKDVVTPVAPLIAALPDEAPPAIEPPPIVEQPEPRAISQKQWNASALDLDSLDLDEELARLEQREIQPATELGRPREDSLSARRDSPEPDDAAWPDSLFSAPADERLAEPEDQPQIDDIEPVKPERTEPSLSLEPVDLDDEPAIPHLRLHDPIDPNARRERLSASDESADDDLPSIEPLRKKRERAEPGVRAEVLQDLTDDPLQLDWQKRRSPWGRRLLWLVLVLLAAGGLAAQYISYHFDELARQDQYRPWFQQICPQIGCTVPSKVDIARIKSSNLVVRSHPEFNGALVVDAIIYNRATFSQPFPLLELRFADLNGHLIASRRFKPGEYLKGDLEGLAEMPPQTPIHIALDILDPGPKAVNYSLSFHSPE
ncbi:zinc finger-domain-containing protein [Pseudomonas chlororaphis]|uniref:Zinc finger-domain-containing protein n=1 Tax=Pseudomonas chlororaphis TaxID=587753 RepID=A0A0A6DHE5_9PSED|nr:zinc finger-domain-containing protein [Pseudomonas chlororaphis]